MKIKGEYIFKSFEEALEFVNQPTNYEKENGIEIVEDIKLIDKPTIKLIERRVSDGSSGLILFFKNSTKHDVWKFWYPDEEQFLALIDCYTIYKKIDKINSKW